ncbi:hypothetical protein ACFPN9_07895 [Bosea massiliensis]|uniref:DUF1640 domain-containing protein n=2 Tax=Bosea massiliensis TaxID=151419 RepID=A0ABW0P1D8_9HYPH
MMARQPLTADDVDAIAKRTVEYLRPVVEQAIEDSEINLLVRMGVDPAKLGDVQKDFAFLRSQREIREAVVKQGIGAVLLSLLALIGTAVAFWFKSGMPR